MLIEATLIGVLIGIVVGALGAGGGILSVPVLVYLLGQNPHQAATLSLIIVEARKPFRLRWNRRHLGRIRAQPPGISANAHAGVLRSSGVCCDLYGA